MDRAPTISTLDVEDDYPFSRIDAAGILGISPHTLTVWIQKGVIDYYRVGGRIYITAGNLRKYWRLSHRPAWTQPELPFGEVAS